MNASYSDEVEVEATPRTLVRAVTGGGKDGRRSATAEAAAEATPRTLVRSVASELRVLCLCCAHFEGETLLTLPT